MKEFIDRLRQLARILGNVSLEEAVNWLEVKENAEQLRAEGHKEEAPE